MANYKDKKKLIEDNSDIFISDYDKNLDYSYLSDIIDQKRAYTAAEKAGDTAGMQKANDRANSIRIQAGSYTAGSDGSKYNRVKRPYETENYSQPDNYFNKERKRVYKKIEDYPSFSYNPENDPLYNTYKDIYLSLGDDAYKRAMGENSLRTGGISNTSALSAATMARNKYNSMLASIIPELYEKAYKKYTDGKDDIYAQLEAIWKSGDKDYEKYRDDVEDYKDNRQYYYEKDQYINDTLQSQYNDENEREYKESRDWVSDNKDNRDYEFEVQKHNDNLALDTKKHDDTIALDTKKHDDTIALDTKKHNDTIALDTKKHDDTIALDTKKHDDTIALDTKKHDDTIALDTKKHDDTIALDTKKHDDTIALDTKKHDDTIALDTKKHKDSTLVDMQKQKNDEKIDKYEIAVKIAKIMYGDNPVPLDKINQILSVID